MSELLELLEARRARMAGGERYQTGDEYIALFDLALAVERRRQAQMRHLSTGGNAPQIPPTWRVVRDAEEAENAALDRLASHLRGGAA